MTYKCDDCDEEFGTLSSKRMHDCSDGENKDGCPICGSELIEWRSGFESEIEICIECEHLLSYEYHVPNQEVVEEPEEDAPDCSYCDSSLTEFHFYSRNKKVIECEDCGYTWENFGVEVGG